MFLTLKLAIYYGSISNKISYKNKEQNYVKNIFYFSLIDNSKEMTFRFYNIDEHKNYTDIF